MFIGVSHACETNEIDVLGDGTQCEISKFEITTTNLSANTEFRFYMSASGTFYVDWGDGTVDTITRTDTTETLYSHTFATSGVKTIRFGGLATGYTSLSEAAIRFGNDEATSSKVATIHGSIGQIMCTLGNSARRQPKFKQTFSYTQITNIPENLFSGVYGFGYKLFDGTFMFSHITSIPENLFINISGAGGDTFIRTFLGCSLLTSIPSGLFKNISQGSGYNFYSTFQGCASLKYIPENLFAHVKAGPYLFMATFKNCTNLSGYIPPSLFTPLNNSSQYPINMMNDTFAGTNLATSCPPGTVQYITGYEDYWDGHVSCVDENLVCDAGEYLPAHGYRCETCPENNYCSGGTYPYSETITSGATQCPNNWYSPSGMSSVAQCGRILHLGDDVVYLRNVKKTTPSLTIKVGDDIFYGNMTTNNVVMHNGATHRLKIRFNDTTYSVYDDTVEP